MSNRMLILPFARVQLSAVTDLVDLVATLPLAFFTDTTVNVELTGCSRLFVHVSSAFCGQLHSFSFPSVFCWSRNNPTSTHLFRRCTQIIASGPCLQSPFLLGFPPRLRMDWIKGPPGESFHFRLFGLPLSLIDVKSG